MKWLIQPSFISFYNGSDVFEVPRILIFKISLDFGNGFYVTSNKEQLIKWSNILTSEIIINLSMWVNIGLILMKLLKTYNSSF